MAPQLQVEESSLEALRAGLFKSQLFYQSGLLVGQRVEDRSFIVHFAPTPPNTESPEVSDMNEASLFNGMPIGWISEHSRQVMRMLPGGLNVLGVYFYASQAHVFSKTSAPTLQKLLKQLALRDEKLLVFNLCSKNRTTACRAYNPQDRSFEGTPIEPKATSVCKKFLRATCDFFIDFTLPLAGHDGKQPFKNFVLERAAYVAPTVTGTLLLDSQSHSLFAAHVPLSEVFKNSTSRQFDLLLQANCNRAPPLDPVRNIGGIPSLHFSGLLETMAFVHNKEGVPALLESLITDIRRSLLARIELLLDDLEDSASATDCLEQLEESMALLPKRVFFPFSDALSLCDYTFPDETTSDLAERAQVLLGIRLDSSSFTGKEFFRENNRPSATQAPDLPRDHKAEETPFKVRTSRLPATTETSTIQPQKVLTEASPKMIKDSGSRTLFIIGMAIVFIAIVLALVFPRQ